MEAITNSSEDLLINSLSFKLPSGASYVQDRKSSTFWSVGSNAYTAVGGVKLIKFQLNGSDSDWLDPQSVVFQFELVNTAPTPGTIGDSVLRPLGQPHLFFKRLRVLAGGSVVEDIQDFGRNMELISSLQSEFVRDNCDIQGFGGRWDSTTSQNLVDLFSVDPTTLTPVEILTAQRGLLPQIAPQKSRIVNFKPLCGLFAPSQTKYLPLKFMGNLTLEFELCDQNDAIITPQSYDALTGYSAIFTSANTTNSWQIQNCCIKCDIVSLGELNNTYIEHLLSGKSLPIEYSTYISQQSSVAGKSFAVQVIRAVSRLQKAFITFYAENGPIQPFRKPTITFHHPMAETSTNPYNASYNPDKEVQINLSLGPKIYPEYPCTNISECYYRLKQAMNLPEYHQHSMSIKFRNYINNKFIFGLSFEKVQDADWTGVNTKAGQILMINCKAMSETGITSNNIASTMYTLLQAQQILEIRDVGCTVYD